MYFSTRTMPGSHASVYKDRIIPNLKQNSPQLKNLYVKFLAIQPNRTNQSLDMIDWVFYISAACTAYCRHGLSVQTMHRALVPTQTLMRQTNAVNASIYTDEIAFTVAFWYWSHITEISADFSSFLTNIHLSNKCPDLC